MKHFIIILITLLITSCVVTNQSTNSISALQIEVDSYGEDSLLTKKKYFLSIADSTINKSDLQFQEFYGYVSKMLNNKGYSIVDSIKEANIIIFFNYGISSPNTQEYTKSIPVWGQTGISTTNTTGNVYVNPLLNKIEYNQSSNTTPTYGVTGYRTVKELSTTYRRYLNLVAYDFDFFVKNKREKRLWQTVITSIGYSNDLRKVLPYMIAGSKKYIGHSSGEKKNIIIYENNKDAISLKYH